MTDPIAGDGPTSDDAALNATGPGTPVDITDVDPDDQPVPPQPYVFDPADVEPGARVLDEVFATLRSGWEAWGAVEAAVAELAVPLPDSCRRVLEQIAVRPLRMEPKDIPGAELDTSAGFGFDAASSASADELALWTALIDKVSAPAAIARLGELLFARRAPRPGDYARRAAQAYFDAVVASDFGYHATVHLLRGWSLARQLKDQALENTALKMMTRRIDTLMEGEFRQKPGAVYPLLKVLCRTPRDTSRARDQREHASAVLSTLAVSETHDHLIEETARLRRSLLDASASAEERAAVDLDEIHGYCRRADGAPHPMVRLHFLERAAKVATTRGQFAEADRITALMQDIDSADLGMQVISTSTPLPAWMPESALDPYTQASTWHTGVALFCTDPCAPTGSVAQNRAMTAGLDKTLSRLMPTVLLDKGLPRTTLNSDEQQDQHDLARTARIWADYQGALLAEALRRIGHRYGSPESEELTTVLLDLGAFDPRLARSLAKGFGYFWTGDYEAAAAIVIPKIETAARALLRELDEPTFKVQISAVKPGGHIQLHPLLQGLEKAALDEDWAYFLRWLLLGPVGRNLRNDYAHGHLDVVTPADAALLLRGAALLITAAPIANDLTPRVQAVPAAALPTRTGRFAESLLTCTKRAAVGVYTAAELLRLRLRGRHQR
ncbi:hypothetical protein [Nocardia gipuzkoensis]|uniref:hypothetical protein n=1 Tax=Nocardia gipuzkoensis TaxID=2749991 RepID=UPI00237E7136|nr:hypothetical protein [Nocardia gipuzkoensis]MDE1675084.1 hypothetical protein [Nocardia gipuzkoensis]